MTALVCSACGRRSRNKGRAQRSVLTAAGTVRLTRLYLVCPACSASCYPLDTRLGVTGFVSPCAQRLLCLAASSWSFDRASANLREFCGLLVCDNTIRSGYQHHGTKMRDWQRDDTRAGHAFRSAGGDVEFQTDGTCVTTTEGWREMQLSIFAKRERGKPTRGRRDWHQWDLPAAHARVIQAAICTGDQLGPSWRRMAGRLGLCDTTSISVIADGAKWIWNQSADHLPGAAGVLDICQRAPVGCRAGALRRGDSPGACVGGRATLLRSGASGLLAELEGASWSVLRGYFESHRDHTDCATRLAEARVIGSGPVEGACKQVLGRRLKQTGARWKVRRVERMVTLCAVQASEQWAAYWAVIA